MGQTREGRERERADLEGGAEYAELDEGHGELDGDGDGGDGDGDGDGGEQAVVRGSSVAVVAVVDGEPSRSRKASADSKQQWSSPA